MYNSPMSRGLLLIVFGSIATLTLFIPALLLSPFRGGNYVHAIGRIWARIIVWLTGTEVTLHGSQRMPKGSYIIVSNHQSAFDIPVLQAYLPVQFKWVSKKEAFRYPFIGWAMHLARYVAVERSHLKEAYMGLKVMEERLKDGYPILIFPEGTRQKEEKVGPFKRGAFVLAKRTGLPLVPVTIRGTKGVIDSFPRVNPGRVRIVIGRPIDPSRFDEKGLRDTTYNIIKEEFERSGVEDEETGIRQANKEPL